MCCFVVLSFVSLVLFITLRYFGVCAGSVMCCVYGLWLLFLSFVLFLNVFSPLLCFCCCFVLCGFLFWRVLFCFMVCACDVPPAKHSPVCFCPCVWFCCVYVFVLFAVVACFHVLLLCVVLLLFLLLLLLFCVHVLHLFVCVLVL